MSLNEWVENDWIKEHKPKSREIRQLIDRTELNLTEAEFYTRDLDWKFNIAYSAILNLAGMALRAEGYRSRAASHHYYTIMSLEFTLKIDSKLVTIIDSFRKIRHYATYERAGVVTESMVQEIIEIAKELKEKVIIWLKEKHSDLYSN